MIENQECLFRVYFYLNPSQKIHRKAFDVFKKYFDTKETDERFWVVFQDGRITNGESKFKNAPKRNMVIDTADEQTVQSINLLPHFFSRQYALSNLKTLRLKVHHHQYNETDWIIFMDGYFFLERIHFFWQAQKDTYKALMIELNQIEELYD